MCNGQAIRRFVGIGLARAAVPRAATLPKFRRLREDEGLTGVNTGTIDAHLGRQGLLLRDGALVDATLIGAPQPAPCCDTGSHHVHGGGRGPAVHRARRGSQPAKAVGFGEIPTLPSFSNHTVEG